MRTRRLTGALLLAALAGGCPGDGGDTWTIAFDTEGVGALSSVWGTGPDDVWIVGGTDAGAEVYHFDGGDWAPHSAPDLPLLVWVYGFGSDDVWTVGTEGGVARWDGADWTVLDPGTGADLWGVFGFTRDDVWIVGGAIDVGEPVILHWDGAGFTPHEIAPEHNPLGVSALFKVWGIDGRLFAVGQAGLILEWDGAEWVQRPAGAEANQDFVSLWGTSSDHIVAVGGRGNARIAEFDGSGWTTAAPSGVGGLNGVFALAPDEVVVCGTNGYVGVYAPSTDTLTPEVPAAVTEFHAMWGDSDGTAYAVGGQFRAPYSGVAMVREAQ